MEEDFFKVGYSTYLQKNNNSKKVGQAKFSKKYWNTKL